MFTETDEQKECSQEFLETELIIL
ncbi:MAG: hypothetical protein AMXMBFR51_18670, partial [Ignavibacteriota bacterium]